MDLLIKIIASLDDCLMRFDFNFGNASKMKGVANDNYISEFDKVYFTDPHNLLKVRYWVNTILTSTLHSNDFYIRTEGLFGVNRKLLPDFHIPTYLLLVNASNISLETLLTADDDPTFPGACGSTTRRLGAALARGYDEQDDLPEWNSRGDNRCK